MYAFYKDPEGLKVFETTMPSGNVGSSSRGNERVSGVFNTTSTSGKVSSEAECCDASVRALIVSLTPLITFSHSGIIASREITKIVHEVIKNTHA